MIIMIVGVSYRNGGVCTVPIGDKQTSMNTSQRSMFMFVVSKRQYTAGMAATTGKRRSFYADLDHLRKCFDNVDSNKSGFIGYSELTKLVESMPMPNAGDSVVSELMQKLDRDKDGKVGVVPFAKRGCS